MISLQILLLAILQGITEFLPISSSAHLILISKLFGNSDQDLPLAISVHLGTLAAVIVFFWRDIKYSIYGIFYIIQLRFYSPEAKLAIHLIVATIPVVLLGFLVKVTNTYSFLSSLKIISWNMIFFGLLLYFVDKHSSKKRSLKDLSIKNSIFIGIFQAIAIIPGTSRSGITITAARLLGVNSEDAVKFSMLLSVPTIIASGVLLAADISQSSSNLSIKLIAVASSISFLSAIFALKVFLLFLKSFSFTPYIIYRILLGLLLLYFSYR